MLLGSTSGCNRVRDTVRGVIAKNFALRTAQRRFYSLDLVKDVDAIAIVRDHAGKALHLSCYSIQPDDL